MIRFCSFTVAAWQSGALIADVSKPLDQQF